MSSKRKRPAFTLYQWDSIVRAYNAKTTPELWEEVCTLTSKIQEIHAILERRSGEGPHVSSDEQIKRLVEALEFVRAMADDRADADCSGDPPRYQPNAWMQMLTEVSAALTETGHGD